MESQYYMPRHCITAADIAAMGIPLEAADRIHGNLIGIVSDCGDFTQIIYEYLTMMLSLVWTMTPLVSMLGKSLITIFLATFADMFIYCRHYSNICAFGCSRAEVFAGFCLLCFPGKGEDVKCNKFNS